MGDLSQDDDAFAVKAAEAVKDRATSSAIERAGSF